MLLISLIFALAVSCFGDEFSNQYSVALEHSLDQGKTWSLRGVLQLSGLDGSLSNAFQASLNQEDVESNDAVLDAFTQLVSDNGLYFVRVSTHISDGPTNPVYVSSFNEACLLAQASLSDVIQLSIDSSRRRVISVSVFPAIPSLQPCGANSATAASAEPMPVLTAFNTTVRVSDVVEGPGPDTQNYLARIDRDRKEKETGQAQDNRSFIAKYWMYIVPVFIFLMLSGAALQEGGGGGAR